jgi:prepilin peptidase CpaA
MTALFPPAALALGLPPGEIGVHLLFGAGVLVVGFFLFQANVIGGGDAKLLAATAVWTGFPGFAPFILWTAIAGGGLAFALLMARRTVPESTLWPEFVNRLLRPKGGVPYGVAIMAGGLMAIPALTYLSAPLTLP